MPRQRRVWKIGEKLPGRLVDGGLACAVCWTVKNRSMFESRPRRGRDGEWRVLTLSICSTCRRKASAKYKAALRAREHAERSEGSGAPPSPRRG